ncbi:MAG: hypothetical protein WAO20_13885 [Acidobacteriota bacterium]
MLCLAVILWLGSLSAPAPEPAPTGMLLLVKGGVELNRDGAQRPARLGELLYAGDQLAVGEGEAVFVYCPLGKRFRLSSGNRSLLASEGIKTLSQPAAEELDDRECAIPKVVLGAESLERIGGMRPRGEPPVTVYMGGLISTGKPRFMWRPVEGARLYQVSVSDELGRRIWSGTTTELSIPFPADRPELPDGWFSWEVAALGDSDVLARQTTPLEVRRPASAGDPRPLAEDELLLQAVELENRGYFAEAASCLRRLGREYPGDARLRRRLAWLYWKAGLLPAFNDEMQALETDSGRR